MASGLLGIGVSGLVAFQRALATTSNNIANANTEGYTRQRVDLSNRAPAYGGGFNIGTGVEVSNVKRVYDNFVATQVRSNTSAVNSLDQFYSGASQLDNLLGDPSLSLSSSLDGYFSSIQDLANDPGSAGARHAFLTEAELTVNNFNQLENQFSEIENQINSGIRDDVRHLNSLADNLRTINGEIAKIIRSDGTFLPNDLMDQRDHIITEMSEIVDIQVIEDDNGSANVFIGNGQSLVVGQKAFTLTTRPGSYDPAKLEIATIQDVGSVDVTSRLTGGSIGGMIDFRDQVLNPQRNALGQIALSFATEVNEQHELGVDLNGQPGQALFSLGAVDTFPFSGNSGGAVSAAVSDHNQVTTSDYALYYNGANAYSLERLSDGQVSSINTGGTSPFTTTIDGVDITIDSAGIAVGDSFLIQPTRNFARDIGLNISQADNIAAASALQGQVATDVTGAPLNSGTGAIGPVSITDRTGVPLSSGSGIVALVFDPNALGVGIPGFNVTGAPGPVAYDPATDNNGVEINFASVGNMRFTMSGVPADGDIFVISDNTSGVGDNRNALALAGMQGERLMQGGSATFGNAYSEMVSEVGSKTRRADISLQAQQGLLNQAVAEHESKSGVNLDEEAANLLKFQNAYQAAAQVISVTQTLFQTLLSSFGR